MKEWCEAVIREMEKIFDVQQRLVMAVVITSVITAVGFEFSEMNLNNVCLPLCRMLCLYPNTKTTPMKCKEFDTLCTLLPGNDDKQVFFLLVFFLLLLLVCHMANSGTLSPTCMMSP